MYVMIMMNKAPLRLRIAFLKDCLCFNISLNKRISTTESAIKNDMCNTNFKGAKSTSCCTFKIAW